MVTPVASLAPAGMTRPSAPRPATAPSRLPGGHAHGAALRSSCSSAAAATPLGFRARVRDASWYRPASRATPHSVPPRALASDGDGDAPAATSSPVSTAASPRAGARSSIVAAPTAPNPGPRKTFFEESYDIAIREYVPTSIKVTVQSNGVAFKLRVESTSAADLMLHWGVAGARAPDRWIMPPASIMPPGTVESSEVCQTPLVKDVDADGNEISAVVVEGDVEDAPHFLNFVLCDKKHNIWYHQNGGDFFRVPCPALPEEEEEEEELEELEESEGPDPEVDSEEHQTAGAEGEAAAQASAATASPAPPSPPAKKAPGGISSLLGTLSSFKRNPSSAPARKAKERAEKLGLSDDFDDDEYELDGVTPKRSTSVASLLQAKARGEKVPKKRPGGFRVGLFGLKAKDDGAGDEGPGPGAKAASKARELEDQRARETAEAERLAARRPPKVDWFEFHSQSHVVHTEVDKMMRVGIRVDVESDAPGASARVRVETDLPSEKLLLHWGVVPRGARADMWTVPAPAMRPEGSKVYGDKALQTPMTFSPGGLGGDFAYAELDTGAAPGGLRFVIKEEGGRDRWFDNYGGDFVVPLPEQAMSSSLISPPAGRAGPPPQAPTEGLEEAQLALGGAAAKTYGGGKENASPYAENCVVVASEAVEAAKQASKQAALATAAARDLPEDGVASTKARRLIAQAEQAKAFARAKAAEAELAASRIREINEQLGLNPNPDKTPEALAREKERAAEDVARMASQSWAGEASAEISEDTLRRWRDEMELTVTKEAEQRAAEAEKAARRLFDENKRLEAEREKEAARARADAEAAEAAKAEEAQRLEAEARAAAATDAARAVAEARAALEAAQTQEETQEETQTADVEAEYATDAYQPPAWFTDPNATSTATPPPAPAGVDGVSPPQPQPQVATPPARSAPGERVQTPTGNGRELLIQGFNWESARLKHGSWYRKVIELAPTLAERGFTTIWLPPPTDSVSAEGYMPRDLYDLNSKYGTLEELRECVAELKRHGIKSLGDAVLNHRCAHAQGPDGLWNQFGGKLDWDASAIVSDDPHFGGRGNRSSGDFFHAAPNIDHSQDFVQRDICEWLRWLQAEVGYDGWRLDYVRGFSGTHVKKYMEATDVHFAVGEYWDTLSYDYDQPQYNQDPHRQRIVKWIDDAGGLAGAFDVTTKGILHAVFERQEYWRLSDGDGQPPGVLGRWPSRAVTFIENHDTGSTQGHWRFPEGFEQLGYVYILTHPGTPTVFWDHLFEWHDPALSECIVKLIEFRKEMGVHSRSSVKILRAEQSVYAAQIDDALVMKIGTGEYSPSEAEWEYHTHGISWCLWRRRGSAQA